MRGEKKEGTGIREGGVKGLEGRCVGFVVLYIL